MKTAGWIFIVIGVLAFLGAASKGHSVFGPLFWIGIGSVLIYLKREKEETNEKRTAVEPTAPKQPEKPQLEEEKAKQQLQPQMRAMQSNEPWLNYRVNLFVDNSNQEGVPIIMDSNYSYNNIFGKLEYENFYGSLKTDHTMLKAGLLQKANGGYIIFQALVRYTLVT